jgi:tetratricopeptide (TPR) repeat protein
MAAKALTGQRLRDFLVAQSPVWLTEQLLRAADRDPALAASLQLAASDRRGVDAIRRELDRAIWIDEEVDEEDAATYVAGVEGALELVERLVADGYADEAVGLAEHAIDLLAEVLDRVYDEGESLGCLHYAREIHLRACAAGSPDLLALAEWLFRRAVGDVDGWGTFDTAPTDYADVLGRAGTDRFRELVEAEFRRLPRRAAGQHSDLRHQAVLRLAEQHARAGGVDALVEVLAKDLTTAERYQRICDELGAAGRIQPALEWARRGLDQFEERTDRGWSPGLPELRQLAVTLYARLGRTREAVELAWRDFVASPSVETYQRLREQGIADGTWPGWRERALDELGSKPRASVPAPSAGPYSWLPPVGHSVLVSVLLFEGDDEAAWRAAREGGCTEELWLELARRRAREHPADAIEVFRRQIDAAIASTKREGYEQAGRLLVETGTCYERMGKAAEFTGYVRQLRAGHRRKRNLTTALDAARLPS